MGVFIYDIKVIGLDNSRQLQQVVGGGVEKKGQSESPTCDSRRASATYFYSIDVLLVCFTFVYFAWFSLVCLIFWCINRKIQCPGLDSRHFQKFFLIKYVLILQLQNCMLILFVKNHYVYILYFQILVYEKKGQVSPDCDSGHGAATYFLGQTNTTDCN